MDEKLSGSYYTPHKTITFMKEYLASQQIDFGSILEPCVGDGRFIDTLMHIQNIESLTAVELFKEKVDKLLRKNYPPFVSVINSDFLEYALKCSNKYDLIIGNPPYINIKNMENTFLDNAKKVCDKLKLSHTVLKNSWVAFVLASMDMLKETGTIFFVLPLEFLQVHYAEQLRGVLEKKFNTIHIITFSERMFPRIEQEACLVYLTNKEQELPYISYKQYADLDSTNVYRQSKIQKNKPLKKWSNAILSDSDLDLLKSASDLYLTTKDLGDSSPGIVTAANNEFILTQNQINNMNCKTLTIPIIAKGVMARNKFEINENLIAQLAEKGERVYLLNLSQTDECNIPQDLKDYLDNIGEKERRGIKIRKSYKCSKRKPWYGVPIVKSGDLVFFKRYDIYPRMCTNPHNIHTTDIAYNIRLTHEFHAESVAFCFYNSLTLTQCEFIGRYYAGGVAELTPSEFKNLSIPYQRIDPIDIERLKGFFDQGKAINEIVEFVNSRTLINRLSTTQIDSLNKIRSLLVKRRRG